MKKKILFITGTDTDIGKTYVARVLADTFASLGQKVSYMKPVQTGCYQNGSGDLRAPDADFVFKGDAEMVLPYEVHVPYRFEPACSPHLAAQMKGVSICADHLKKCLDAISRKADITIIEGAGGVMVPLTENYFMLELIKRFTSPALLVTSGKLGTLNHTRLSVDSLKSAGVAVSGAVVNNPEKKCKDFIYSDNLKMIEQFLIPSPVLELPFGAQVSESVKEFCNEIDGRI
ncbi:dethiobiotin synthase [Chitinispirillales bacterium ANBcel5]|uniref:dethiobiotin synthase n=1 Tax=Cellulosispirillum alkaliphilum TaxID=3039283 RepID=UPI002A5094FC|nr:dethiobiotin synthase [Chitinispirillales bacterium ANBcel5]